MKALFYALTGEFAYEIMACERLDTGEVVQTTYAEADFFGVYAPSEEGLPMHVEDFPTFEAAFRYITQLKDDQ